MSNWDEYIQLDYSFYDKDEFHYQVEEALDQLWSTPEGRAYIITAYEKGDGYPLTIAFGQYKSSYDPYDHIITLNPEEINDSKILGTDGQFHPFTLNRMLTHEIIHAAHRADNLKGHTTEKFQDAMNITNQEKFGGKFSELIANLPEDFWHDRINDQIPQDQPPASFNKLAAELGVAEEDAPELREFFVETFIQRRATRIITEENPTTTDNNIIMAKYYGEVPRADYSHKGRQEEDPELVLTTHVQPEHLHDAITHNTAELLPNQAVPEIEQLFQDALHSTNQEQYNGKFLEVIEVFPEEFLYLLMNNGVPIRLTDDLFDQMIGSNNIELEDLEEFKRFYNDTLDNLETELSQTPTGQDINTERYRNKISSEPESSISQQEQTLSALPNDTLAEVETIKQQATNTRGTAEEFATTTTQHLASIGTATQQIG